MVYMMRVVLMVSFLMHYSGTLTAIYNKTEVSPTVKSSAQMTRAELFAATSAPDGELQKVFQELRARHGIADFVELRMIVDDKKADELLGDRAHAACACSHANIILMRLSGYQNYTMSFIVHTLLHELEHINQHTSCSCLSHDPDKKAWAKEYSADAMAAGNTTCPFCLLELKELNSHPDKNQDEKGYFARASYDQYIAMSLEDGELCPAHCQHVSELEKVGEEYSLSAKQKREFGLSDLNIADRKLSDYMPSEWRDIKKSRADREQMIKMCIARYPDFKQYLDAAQEGFTISVDEKIERAHYTVPSAELQETFDILKERFGITQQMRLYLSSSSILTESGQEAIFQLKTSGALVMILNEKVFSGRLNCVAVENLMRALLSLESTTLNKQALLKSKNLMGLFDKSFSDDSKQELYNCVVMATMLIECPTCIEQLSKNALSNEKRLDSNDINISKEQYEGYLSYLRERWPFLRKDRHLNVATQEESRACLCQGHVKENGGSYPGYFYNKFTAGSNVLKDYIPQKLLKTDQK